MRGYYHLRKARDLIYHTGKRRDDAQCLRLLEQSAAAGYARGHYALATWYLHGTGVKRNYKRAVRHLQIAVKGRVPAPSGFRRNPAANGRLAVSGNHLAYNSGGGRRAPGLVRMGGRALIRYRRA